MITTRNPSPSERALAKRALYTHGDDLIYYASDGRMLRVVEDEQGCPSELEPAHPTGALVAAVDGLALLQRDDDLDAELRYQAQLRVLVDAYEREPVEHSHWFTFEGRLAAWLVSRRLAHARRLDPETSAVLLPNGVLDVAEDDLEIWERPRSGPGAPSLLN